MTLLASYLQPVFNTGCRIDLKINIRIVYNCWDIISAEISMGEIISCCSANVFKELFERYGEEFTKLMVAQKIKRVIGEEFAGLLTQFQGVFREFESKTNTTVQKGRDQLQNVYMGVKNKVNSTIPGGINALQKIKGESIDEFSGYNKLQAKVESIKGEALQKIDGEKVKLQGEMQSKKTQMVQKVQDQRPKIPVYEQLPNNVKTILMTEAQTKFAKEIGENKSQIIEEIAKSFNVGNVQALYSKIDPQNPLKSIVGSALGQFTSSLGSGGFGSTVNNLIQEGLTFFHK